MTTNNDSKNSNLPPVDLNSIASLMEEVHQIGLSIGKMEDSLFKNQIEVTAKGKFTIVVMGEQKKGKSSFINALLGENKLVPVHNDVATSTIYKIVYGDQIKYRVFFKDKSKKPIDIDRDLVEKYGTENGNPDNKENVDFIAVSCNSPFLIDGTVIVDTPGVGGLFKKHRAISYDYAPKADAILFLTDSTKPLEIDEIKYLKELYTITENIYFLQTKTDISSSIKAEEEIEKRNFEIIQSETSGVGIPLERIHYFKISSENKINADRNNNTKLLEISGFPKLISFIKNHLKTKNDLEKAKTAITLIEPKIEDVEKTILDRKKIILLNTKEELLRVENELQHAENQINEWKTVKRMSLFKELESEQIKLHRKYSDSFDTEINPLAGNLFNKYKRKIEEFRIEDFSSVNTEVLESYRGDVALFIHQLNAKCKDDYYQLLQNLCAKTNYELNAVININDISNKIEEIPLSEFDSKTHINYSSSIMKPTPTDKGKSIVSTITMTASITATIGSFLLGPVGGILGGLAGGVIGAAIGLSDQEEKSKMVEQIEKSNRDREKQMEKNKLEMKAIQSLTQQATNCYKLVTRNHKDAFEEFKKQAEQVINTMVKSFLEDIIQKKQTLQLSKKSTQEEISAQINTFENKLSELNNIKQQLQSLKRLLSP